MDGIDADLVTFDDRLRASTGKADEDAGRRAADGLVPHRVEAMAFAWLTRQTLNARPGTPPAVTVARGPCCPGASHPGLRSGPCSPLSDRRGSF